MHYTGPNYKKAIEIGGRRYTDIKSWDQKRFEAEVKSNPALEKYFSKNKKPGEK